uniref:Uncharacterized protein n=1 Tax=Medicago truncatula TaxID=3880 RepID=B7FHE9_MEDTR|nr:unknown [Medicago truncatula]
MSTILQNSPIDLNISNLLKLAPSATSRFECIAQPVKALKKSFAFYSRSFKNSPLAIFNLVQLKRLRHCSIIKGTW